MVRIDDREFVDTLFQIVGRTEAPSVSSVYITPYQGSAGTAGVVLTVFGTPPSATLLVPLGGSYKCYSGWGEPRVVEPGTAAYTAIFAWLERHGLVKDQAFIERPPS